MSIHLTIDEMLEILRMKDAVQLSDLAKKSEDVACLLAATVTTLIPELVWTGTAKTEPLAFAGTCATFRPNAPGPVPDALLVIDAEQQEWRDMCEDMEQT